MIAIFWVARNIKKSIFSRSKQRNENPGYVFLDFTLFNNITLEKTRKNIFSEARAFERDFMKPKMT